jgi:hypothetical protein
MSLQLLFSLGKTSIGRLRPHFFDVCKPANMPDNCSGIFITLDVCTGEDTAKIREARFVLLLIKWSLSFEINSLRKRLSKIFYIFKVLLHMYIVSYECHVVIYSHYSIIIIPICYDNGLQCKNVKFFFFFLLIFSFFVCVQIIVSVRPFLYGYVRCCFFHGECI